MEEGTVTENDMRDWLVVPGATNPPLIPVDPPDLMGGFRFARTSDGAEPDGTPTISAERGRVEDEAEKQRLLGYFSGGSLVVERNSWAADRFDPSRRYAVQALFRTDGTWVWPGATEYYLQWHGVAPEPDFYRHIVANGYTCPPVTDEVTTAAREAVFERADIWAARIDEWKASQEPAPEVSADGEPRFPAAVDRALRGLGWQPGRDVRSTVEQWLTAQAPTLAQLSSDPETPPYQAIPAAVEALNEFGGLVSVANGSGQTSAQVPFVIFPSGRADDLMSFAYDVQALADRLQVRAFQVGTVERGMGGLVVDENGKVYAVGPVQLYLGATFDEALSRMLEGIRAQELYEVGL
jgi:hypothetical protein